MLPSELLRTRTSGGRIRPLYAPLDLEQTALVERITGFYRDGVGNRKGALIERLKEVENESQDYKLVRGLSMLLERRSTFEAESELDPVEARRAVFREASRTRASNAEERARVLRRVSAELGTSSEALERTLFSDVEEELKMRDFQPFPSAGALLRQYNLSLMQTLLFKSLRVEFSASGNWKNIFRDVKRLGLIYSVERGKSEGQFTVSLDGPLSLFKMTERYGTSIAKLLPRITASDSWNMRAEILMRNRGGKILAFEADSGELKDLLPGRGDAARGDLQRSHVDPLYDSSTEEKFARSFLSYGTGWALRREPEPLVAGMHVLIPDFSFEKDGMKVYLEVVGFWTPEYLERKINKLNLVAGVDMIIAADESLACSKLERLRGKALVMYYRRDVPLKPIVEHLRGREGTIVRREVEELRGGGAIQLSGDVVEIEEIAREKGVAVASVKMALQDLKPEGYVRVSDRLFLSTAKLDEIDEKLRGVVMLTDALGMIEASGVKEEGGKVLDVLGYTSVWEGMDMDKVKISKRADTTTKVSGRA
jgi:uncharacterized protein